MWKLKIDAYLFIPFAYSDTPEDVYFRRSVVLYVTCSHIKCFRKRKREKKCDYYLFSWHIFVSRPVVPFSTSYMQSRREMNKTLYLFMWRPELSFITQHTSVVIWTVAQPVFIWFLLCLFYCRFFFWLF